MKRLIDRLNLHVPEHQPKLKVPSIKFNRRIGQYKGQTFNLDGEPIPREGYTADVASVMPTAADRELLRSILKDNDWIQPKKSDD